MNAIDVSRYGTAIASLLERGRKIPLGPGRPDESAENELRTLADDSWLGAVADQDAAKCCRAGLWFRFGFLDESHTISQSIHTREGSYWHALMHRHEPDYGNSKYWFRQVGDHPIFSTLGHQAAQLAAQWPGQAELVDDLKAWAAIREWDPFRFVDYCQRQEARGDAAAFCLAVVELEWMLLFDFCFDMAKGTEG